MDLLVWLLFAALACGCTLASRSLFHFYQLENYQFRGYFISLKRNWKRAIVPGLCMSAAVLFALLDTGMMTAWPVLQTLLWIAVLIAAGFALQQLADRQGSKKRFVLTARMKRLYGISIAVQAGLCFLCCLLAGTPVTGTAVLNRQAGFTIALTAYPLLLPLWVFCAAFIAWPVELFIRHLYFRDAQKILAARDDLIRIGITGSYGKTSVKFILRTILTEKKQVCSPPGSFNTPMGLARVIRNDLRPAHQVFLAEMGARHRGDIRELCRLVHPNMGVLTSIGEQHLDTFRTLDNIVKTKYDLIRSMKGQGVSFFVDDGGICTQLWEKTPGRKWLAALRATENADVWAGSISTTSTGSRFTLYTRDGHIDCETQLLGEHNILNIVLSAAVALELGLSLKEIRRGIARVQSVPHRLQLLPAQGGMTIIDDAFNSNPRGAEAALKVLGSFEGRRIVITPGMVELGEREAELNRAFGEKMAAAADCVILVGPKHTAPIREGLAAAGMPEDRIYTVRSLAEAREKLSAIGRSGDVVLLENDLPDNYAE